MVYCRYRQGQLEEQVKQAWASGQLISCRAKVRMWGGGGNERENGVAGKRKGPTGEKIGGSQEKVGRRMERRGAVPIIWVLAQVDRKVSNL